jgi:8-oxo-dGTP diphosphatase
MGAPAAVGPVVVGPVVVGPVVAGPVVVGAAIIRDGRVFAARRGKPPELAGRWELPGGKVEPGESETAALRRECGEELGVKVEVQGRLGPDVALPTARPGGTLRVFLATLATGSVEPVAREHTALRWVGVEELAELDWLDADRELLPALAAALLRST